MKDDFFKRINATAGNKWRKISGMQRWESNDDQVDVAERRPGKWSVVSIYGMFKDKWFTSEKKAMAYARNYMKNN